MEWILLWRWTRTRMSSMGTWKRWWASMTSRPLFMSVAESMVILDPMCHVGCARARSGVTSASSSRERPKKGPPEQVSHRRLTSSLLSPTRHWKMALCSESTGSS